jgi:hypothetical protein
MDNIVRGIIVLTFKLRSANAIAAAILRFQKFLQLHYNRNCSLICATKDHKILTTKTQLQFKTSKKYKQLFLENHFSNT